MKIYTKTGDTGTTSLIGGVRVPKYHPRIEAYGTVDELNSYRGLIRDQTIDEHSFNVIVKAQHRLMAYASILVSDCKNFNVKIPLISDEDDLTLEQEMDVMDQQIPKITSFILLGDHTGIFLSDRSKRMSPQQKDHHKAGRGHSNSRKCNSIPKLPLRLSFYIGSLSIT